MRASQAALPAGAGDALRVDQTASERGAQRLLVVVHRGAHRVDPCICLRPAPARDPRLHLLQRHAVRLEECPTFRRDLVEPALLGIDRGADLPEVLEQHQAQVTATEVPTAAATTTASGTVAPLAARTTTARADRTAVTALAARAPAGSGFSSSPYLPTSAGIPAGPIGRDGPARQALSKAGLGSPYGWLNESVPRIGSARAVA